MVFPVVSANTNSSGMPRFQSTHGTRRLYVLMISLPHFLREPKICQSVLAKLSSDYRKCGQGEYRQTRLTSDQYLAFCSHWRWRTSIFHRLVSLNAVLFLLDRANVVEWQSPVYRISKKLRSAIKIPEARKWTLYAIASLDGSFRSVTRKSAMCHHHAAENRLLTIGWASYVSVQEMTNVIQQYVHVMKPLPNRRNRWVENQHPRNRTTIEYQEPNLVHHWPSPIRALVRGGGERRCVQ